MKPRDIKKFDGAGGETRTPTTFVTATSRLRVYQFHHVGIYDTSKTTGHAYNLLDYFGIAPDLSAAPFNGATGIAGCGASGCCTTGLIAGSFF